MNQSDLRSNHRSRIQISGHFSDLSSNFSFFLVDTLSDRVSDGIHWNAKAHRWLTNMILSHIAQSWGVGLPTFVSWEHSKGQKMSNEANYIFTHNGEEIEVPVKRKDVSSS